MASLSSLFCILLPFIVFVYVQLIDMFVLLFRFAVKVATLKIIEMQYSTEYSNSYSYSII